MSIEEMKHRLMTDLNLIGIPADEVDFFIRPFSKTYYGRYFPVVDSKDRPKIYVYPYENVKGDLMPYEQVLDIAIHEMCHHIQYSNGHVRVKGVMHDTNFWKLYNRYHDKASTFFFGGGKVAEEKAL